ncbi:Hypothetical predicted protein [Podarcis lilfordi]|uniref:Uncharacterized protein n=1 Tax=Podarcis lilfordi TaxID=74358 RepID=A0AA35PGU3_9SAUR|nr:Hypothetical predicted protein [Podarcis lilfordi]
MDEGGNKGERRSCSQPKPSPGAETNTLEGLRARCMHLRNKTGWKHTSKLSREAAANTININYEETLES